MTKRKGRGLSSEDKALWNRVAQTAKPLRPTSAAMDLESEPPKAGSKESAPRPIPTFQISGQNHGPSTTATLLPTPAESLGQAPVQMDRKAFGKLKRGKLKPDAKIDLHGLTQAQAHPRLTAFIGSAHAKGARLVLVITGKGKEKPEDGPIPVRTGVLKHQVPQWLSLPPLAQIVLQVVPAHLKHGGEGAYYVYLKRRR